MNTEQRVEFRLFNMECCGHLLCWVNPRMPSYCPSCGKSVYPQCKSWVTFKDDDASLTLRQERHMCANLACHNAVSNGGEHCPECRGNDEQAERAARLAI